MPRRRNSKQHVVLSRPCDQCPFLAGGAGVRLHVDRYAELIEHDTSFICHKTIGNGDRPCAGWFEFTRNNGEYRGTVWRILAMGSNPECEAPEWADEVADSLEDLENFAI